MAQGEDARIGGDEDQSSSSAAPPSITLPKGGGAIRGIAGKLGTSLDEIQRLYRSSVDVHTAARLQLGLCQETDDAH